MKGRAVVFSSGKDNWTTPKDLYDKLHAEFNFTVDGAADSNNTLCAAYWDIEHDALKQAWGNERVWCNPPYSNWQAFVKKAYESRGLSVLLLPSRTDTKAFHNYIYKNPRVEIRFIRGRLKFSNSENSAPFPSMIVIFKEIDK